MALKLCFWVTLGQMGSFLQRFGFSKSQVWLTNLRQGICKQNIGKMCSGKFLLPSSFPLLLPWFRPWPLIAWAFTIASYSTFSLQPFPQTLHSAAWVTFLTGKLDHATDLLFPGCYDGSPWQKPRLLSTASSPAVLLSHFYVPELGSTWHICVPFCLSTCSISSL